MGDALNVFINDSVDRTIPMFQDSTSITYGDETGYNLCGTGQTYQVVDSNGNDLSSDLITITGQTLSVHPTLTDYSSETTINAKFVVNLPDPHDTPYDTAFVITIKNPCDGAIFSTSPVPSIAISNTILAPTTTVDIPVLSYTRSDGEPTDVDCGIQSYTVSSSSTEVISVAFLSITLDTDGTPSDYTDTLSLYSADDNDIDVHNVYISIALTSYPSTQQNNLSVQATLSPCVATISVPTVTGQSYDIGKSAKEY